MTTMRDDFEVKVEFLVARLGDDEKTARALKPGKNTDLAGLQARVLADVETKRRLLSWMYEPQEKVGDWGNSFWSGVAARAITEQWMGMRRPVIEELVLSYADHPDFHPEWKLIEIADQYEPGEDKPSTRARARTV
ncbi:DUF6221 family protein [Streptomyces sp. NPDC059651]|uniref:DUF6221 family protein n=1 Tax=Streptomyces sp. NPDC059651 TaxID=3346897 RepID=UPI00367EB60B